MQSASVMAFPVTFPSLVCLDVASRKTCSIIFLGNEFGLLGQ